jgi:hypothetical protein
MASAKSAIRAAQGGLHVRLELGKIDDEIGFEHLARHGETLEEPRGYRHLHGARGQVHPAASRRRA